MLAILKWVAVAMFLVATMGMFNQHIASKSVIPWSLFFAGNLIWLVDSIVHYNLPWLVLSACFCIIDGGLIIQRIRNQNVIT